MVKECEKDPTCADLRKPQIMYAINYDTNDHLNGANGAMTHKEFND